MSRRLPDPVCATVRTDVRRRRPSEPVAADHRVADDRGSTSLTVALLTPLLVVLMFAAVQAALWTHARTEARAVARQAAALVARSGASVADAQATASANLADDELTDVEVVIERRGSLVVVTVRGRAPGIIRGTARDVSVTEAVPVEEVVPR